MATMNDIDLDGLSDIGLAIVRYFMDKGYILMSGGYDSERPWYNAPYKLSHPATPFGYVYVYDGSSCMFPNEVLVNYKTHLVGPGQEISCFFGLSAIANPDFFDLVEEKIKMAAQTDFHSLKKGWKFGPLEFRVVHDVHARLPLDLDIAHEPRDETFEFYIFGYRVFRRWKIINLPHGDPK